MLDIVSLRLSFVLGICIGHMLQCLCPLQQIIVHHSFDSLMDDKKFDNSGSGGKGFICFANTR